MNRSTSASPGTDRDRILPLTEEASALRVEALVSSHDAAAARAAGTRYLAAHPDGVYAARVTALLAKLP